METVVKELHDILESACRSSFRILRTTKKTLPHKSVPWWTEGLTILRKWVNTQRRRYQWTRGNNNLQDQWKVQYLAIKAEHAATTRKERSTSWKQFCNMTSTTNPWNEKYRIAVGRRKQAIQITTLRKQDGKLTNSLHETLTHMLRNFTPEDNHNNVTAYHRKLRVQTQESIDTADDKEFTVQEIKNAVASMGNKKTPGEDDITSEIFKTLVEILPRYITAISNGCLRSGTFPTRWKKAKILPITKPRKESSDEVSKFCPISLLDIGGRSAGKGTDEQNKPSRVFTRIYERKSVWFHTTKRHHRCGHGS